MNKTLIAVLCIVVLLFSQDVAAQSYKWYVLQSVSPLSEENSKTVISAIKAYVPDAEIWMNAGTSKTLGCKYPFSIEWGLIITELIDQNIFLADISDGQIHKAGPEAHTSIWYVQALYFQSHPEERPLNFTAKLNASEWAALPEDVRMLYEAKGNYAIITE